MDKDTIVCVVGALALLAILGYVAWLALDAARQQPPTLIDKLPKIIRLWRDARTWGERALIVLGMVGTALRRGGTLVVAFGVIGTCITAFAALCSSGTAEILREVRLIMRDLLEAFSKPGKSISAPTN